MIQQTASAAVVDRDGASAIHPASIAGFHHSHRMDTRQSGAPNDNAIVALAHHRKQAEPIVSPNVRKTETGLVSRLAPSAARRAATDSAVQLPSRVQADTRHFETLMLAAQDGDARAYRQLLTEVTPLLRAVVRRRWRFVDAADVEDLVQEILISVHAARASYDPKRPFLPWLHAIANSRIVDAVRRHTSRAAHEVVGEAFERATSERPYDETKSDFGDPQLLMQAIRELPARQRKVVELLKLQELSLKQASAVSGMSLTALKVSMHRALISLRKKMGVAVER